MARLRVFTAFSGYDSQCMALDKLGIDYELVGWSEIDKYAIQAHNAVYPQWTDRNYGDISKIDWNQVPDFDLFTYSFPCFVAGTLVLTSNGYKSIEQILPDDKVLTHTNQFRNVITPMIKQYKGNLFRIKAMSFDELICTPEHPFYARKKYRYGHSQVRAFKEPEWVEIKDLTKAYYLGYAINQKSSLPSWKGVVDNRWGHGKISNKLSDLFNNRNFWYIMGRYVGDGWKRTNQQYGSSIIICCSERNKDSLVDALNQIGYHYTEVCDKTVTKLHISSNELHSFVERYGYYAHGKRIDYETMNLPKHLLRSFIDGVIDSDGYINKHGLYKISSVSKELIYGLGQCIAKAFDTPFSIYKTLRPEQTIIEGRLCSQRDTYTITFKLYKGKQDKAFYEDGYIWFPINSIVSEYTETDVFNMSVECDESYTANGCIVHNCQDISSAGKQRGLQEGSGTRSSLLWECQKAIEVKRPKYCLMENVAALVSEKFRPFFLVWERLMCRYGYTNYNKVLNAKNYGIPQNRERIFMVSILDPNKAFYWPEPFKLEKRLKDVLEQNVDEKYYLSDRMIKGFLNTDANKSHGHNFTPKDGDGIAFTIRTAPGSRVDDTFIKEFTSVQKDNLLAEPLRITQATKKGFVEVMPGSLFDMSYPESKTRRGRVQEGGKVSPTLMASGDAPCYYEGTAKTLCLNSKVDGKQPSLEHRIYDSEGIATAMTTGFHPNIQEPTFRIRKLTPRECFRLMGVSESDIDKIQQSGVSQSQQYRMAGNSIVVDVLEHIFRKMFVDTGQESQQLSLF